MPDPQLSLLLMGAVGSYMALAVVAYLTRRVTIGPFHDPEIEARGDSPFFPMSARLFFAWALSPLWRVVVWSGLPATAITTLALLLSLGSGMAVATGHLALGGWLYLGAGVCDVLDGRIARLNGTASARGAAIDSVLDRYSDAAVLAGVAWLLRDSWQLVFPLLALIGSFLVSYVRARGEGLGQSVKVGLMQRAERVVLLGGALAFSPVVSELVPSIHAITLVSGVVAVLAVTTQITAFRRLTHLLRALDDAPKKERSGWRRLLPASVSALVATGADFGLVVLLVESAEVSATTATAAGCVLGGVINFLMNRHWTFGSKDRPVPQALRYTIVSGTSALLNSAGVALVLLAPLPDYRIGWLLVRGLVFLCWNFPLQRDYVYGPAGRNKPPALDPSEPTPAEHRLTS